MFFKQKYTLTRFFYSPLATVILILQVTSILIPATSLFAQTRYVQPSSEIVVRRGAGNDYKIIAMVKDGTAVEFIEEGETHAKIRLANGKEGWIVKRFLSVDPPLAEVVAALRIENETIAKKELDAGLKFDAVNATLNQTEQVLNSTITERNQLKASYLKLQNDTADVLQIKKNMQLTLKNNQTLSREMAALQQENDTLKNSIAMKWFLAGGGVLLLGIILGGIFCRSRKARRPSLL